MSLFETKSGPTPAVCGHRGASGHAPENTLVAFRRAKELGATWIEFDVQLSADGVPIILHDDTLARTTNLGQQLRPTQLTLAELKDLDAGSWFSPEFAGEKIPTLEEVFEACGSELGLNIEIKSTPNFEADNGLEQKIADLVRRYKLEDTALISSFDPHRLASLHRYDPGLRLAFLYEARPDLYLPDFDPIVTAKSFGAVALHPPFRIIDSSLVERTRTNGLDINTWTVNEIPDMERMVALGLDIIITNYPDRLVKVLEQTSKPD
jgi:glycerophosphoryl diester phosphodiesterase